MIIDTLREIISEAMGARLKIDAADINENTEFIADLHADSVDIATIICDIEDEFNIEIEEEQLEGIETVGDVAERIEALV
jgi:acyl carrier protein